MSWSLAPYELDIKGHTGLVVALTAFVIFSLIGKKSDKKTIKTFFEYKKN